MYGEYRVPNPEAPYPQNYILDKHGRVHSWEAEYDLRQDIDTIAALLRYDPPANVDVVPDTTSVQPGQSLAYEATLTNNTAAELSFLVWIEAILADSTRSLLAGPLPFELPAGPPVAVPLSATIPLTWPPGSYSLKVSIGPSAGEIWEVDGFGFLVE